MVWVPAAPDFYIQSAKKKQIPEIIESPMRRWLDDLSVRTRVILLLGAIVITTVLIMWL